MTTQEPGRSEPRDTPVQRGHGGGGVPLRASRQRWRVAAAYEPLGEVPRVIAHLEVTLVPAEQLADGLRGGSLGISSGALGRAEWSGKRCIQGLKVLRREGYRKRHSVFLCVRGRAGFWDCYDVPAANHPGERHRGGRAAMDRANLRQRAVAYYEVLVAAERGVRHDRQVVLLTPRQEIPLNATVVETVSDLIGGAAMALWNAEEIFHLANVEIGYAPGANFP